MQSVKNKICFSTSLVFFLSVQLTVAQPQKEFYFGQIQTEQGLSNGIVNDVLKDRQGFLWIATLNGLNCFDGSHCLVWKADPGKSDQLSSDGIFGLCEDTDGNIWCAHNAGISRYNKRSNTFTNYKLIDSLTGKRSVGTSNGIICTRKGEIVTYSVMGVFVLDKKKEKFIKYPGFELDGPGCASCNGVNNKSFLEDPYKNGIWMGTSSGMKYFDLDKRIFLSYKNNPDKNPIFNNHYTARLILNNNKDLVFFDNVSQAINIYSAVSEKITTVPFVDRIKKPFYVDCMLIDRSDNMWLSINNTYVLYYESKSGKLYTVKHQNELGHSIAADYFQAALQDSSGNIFLGTVNGISHINQGQNFISIVRFPDSVSYGRKYYLHQLLNCDKQNNIWFAPSYQYLLKYNPAEQSFQSFHMLNLPKNKITDGINISTMEADSDKLYFGTVDGIYTYNVASGTFEKLKQIPASEKIEGKYIFCTLLTSKKELWFTSHHNGVFRYNTVTGEYSHYLHDSLNPKSFTDQYVFELLEDHAGNIWFCVENDDLIKFNRQKDSFEYFTGDTADTDFDSYYSFVADKENNLWVQGFLSGLSKFDTRQNKFVPGVHFDGLSNLQYNYLLMDDANRIWLSYFSQYSVLDLNSGSVKNFEVDFARTNDYYANYCCRMADGRIAAESRSSFFIFDPRYYEDSNPLEPITVSDFSVGQNTSPFIFSDSTIRLEAKKNFFSISFSTLSVLNNKDMQFAYKLEGMSDDWTYCGSRQTAYFTNLSGGNYVFKVKAKSSGEWKESAVPIHIAISKVFYATVWFRLLLLLGLAACAGWYVRLVKKRNLKRESDKAISYFANSLQGKNKVEELLWDITHNVITRTDFVDCVVYLVDAEKKALVQKAAFGNKNPEQYEILNPIEIPFGKGIVGTVAQTGVAEIVSDTTHDSRYIADDTSRLSEIAVPIIAEGKVIGVIDSEHPKNNFFTKEHLALLQTIASITATKIIRAQREEEIILNEQHLEDLKAQVTQTRQQALQAQMNPHFIFNCLNSINGFILQNDAATASTFLIKFSKLIRLILEHSNEKVVSLHSELDALKLYIEMESLRFEKKFSYKINVDENIYTETVQVPPLILQPFVENSIWHGLLHKETEGHLQVSVTQSNGSLEFIIEDNGIGREKSAGYKSKISTHKKSLGLKLTKERIRLLNNEGNMESFVKIVDLKNENGAASGTRVIISMPAISDLN